jgi:hypothetical protein
MRASEKRHRLVWAISGAFNLRVTPEPNPRPTDYPNVITGLRNGHELMTGLLR